MNERFPKDHTDSDDNSIITYVVFYIRTAVPVLLHSSHVFSDTSSRHPGHPHIFSTSCWSSSSDLAPCSSFKKYRAVKAMLSILCTIMGTASGMKIYIYLFLCCSFVQRDRWIYITNNWSSFLLCCVFNAIPCTHCTSSALWMSFAFSTHSLSSRCSVFCFYPSGCPTYDNNTSYSLGKQLAEEFHAAHHELHSYLLITSLFCVES